MTGAAILAGGYGRANGFTTQSKLTERLLGETTVIAQVVQNVLAIEGISPIVVVLNKQYGETIQRYLEHAGFRGLEFVYQPDRFGPADAFHRTLSVFREHLASDAMTVFGDMPNLQTSLMREMIDAHQQSRVDGRRPTLTISTWPFQASHPLAPYMWNYAYLHANGMPNEPTLRLYTGIPPVEDDEILSSLYVVNLNWFDSVFRRIVPHRKDEFAPERHMPNLIELACCDRQSLLIMRNKDIAEQIIGVDSHTPESLDVVRDLHANRFAPQATP